VLRTDDVAWGETIDGRLEFTAQDGSGVAYTDELVEYSFTRPTREDCEAVAAPPPTPPSSAPSTSPAPSSTPGGNGGGQAPPSGTASPTPAPSSAPQPSGPAAPGAPDGSGGGSGTQEVVAGDTVTLEASGFLPGELVIIQLHGSDDVLGTATAGADGTVQVEVRIPDRTSSGAATLDLVGNESEVVSPVQLQVAGAERPVVNDGIGDLVPLTAAAAALVAAMAGLVSVAGSRRSAGRRHPPFRHA